jgi:RNA processing factor Prp31
VLELLRGTRLHLEKFLKGLEHGDLERSQVCWNSHGFTFLSRVFFFLSFVNSNWNNQSLLCSDSIQVGLAHSYSRSKVKFNIHRADNMIIQAIAILDQIDKDINTFCMRIRLVANIEFPSHQIRSNTKILTFQLFCFSLVSGTAGISQSFHEL